jgi:hypothetical protein
VALQASGAGYTGLTRYYTLQSTTNLIDPSSWITVLDCSNIVGADQTVTATQSAIAKKFYRLSVTLQ